MYLDEDTLAYAKQREKGKKMKIKSPIDKAASYFRWAIQWF
jgi:hypothetical protein